MSVASKSVQLAYPGNSPQFRLSANMGCSKGEFVCVCVCVCEYVSTCTCMFIANVIATLIGKEAVCSAQIRHD